MGDSNITGSVLGRQGSVPVQQSYRVPGSTSNTAVKFLRVLASAEKPVVIEAQIVVTTADAGTTPTLSVGYTASGYTDLINAESTATAATGGTFLPASNAIGKKIVTADTDLYYKQGGVCTGNAVSTILLRIYPINLDTTVI
jgi:hypothetical protein